MSSHEPSWESCVGAVASADLRRSAQCRKTPGKDGHGWLYVDMLHVTQDELQPALMFGLSTSIHPLWALLAFAWKVYFEVQFPRYVYSFPQMLDLLISQVGVRMNNFRPWQEMSRDSHCASSICECANVVAKGNAVTFVGVLAAKTVHMHT